MEINNPLFWIPDGNNKKEQKLGRGNPPSYKGKKSNFEEHKRQRVAESDVVLELVQKPKSPIIAPHDKIFYEMEFHEEALSKSTQPRKLLESNNLDIYAQISENTFLVASTSQNLMSFRNAISRFDLKENENESAFLSAITKISVISRDDRLALRKLDKETVNALLFLADSLSEDEAKLVTKQITEMGSSDANYFVSHAGAKVVFGRFKQSFINAVSESDPSNPVVRIEESINFFTPQALPIEYDYKDVELEELELDAKVVLVDSGICDHPLISPMVIGREDYIKNSSEEDTSHGTFVAGRVIFGNDIERQVRSQNSLIPQTKVVDIKVIKKDVGASDIEIIGALGDVLEKAKYKDIRVYSLSLNDENPIFDEEKCFFTRELDALAYQYKVCFVVSAGNQKQYDFHQYPDCLYLPEAVITPPADLVNGLSVGSLADTESSRSLALNNEPSPFTRLGLRESKKPDLVHFGGNLDEYASPAGIGVRSLGKDLNKIYEDVGTSYSAPLVSSITAQLVAYLKSIGQTSIDLAKALLLHSATYSLPFNSGIDHDDLKHIVGFGIPDFERALSCINSTATFVYVGKIEAKKYQVGTTVKRQKEYKHKIRFVVPNELVGKGKKIKIKGTLVYTPLVNKMGKSDYTQADIEVNLHYINSKGTEVGAGLSKEAGDHRPRWGTIKSFTKSSSHYRGGDWEVWLTLTTRGKAEDVDYSQEYALVITVEDITPDISKRVALYEVIRDKHSVYVPITQRIDTKVKISN